MIDRLKGKENIVKFLLGLAAMFGGYLIIAWASYSPLDNAWSAASSVTAAALNKTGAFGAWLIDLLFAMFGKVAFLVPFALTGVPCYLLLTAAANRLHGRSAALWSLSFLALMVGLAGLAAVLLSHTPYYLAGGFVGGMLLGSLDDSIGQFGVLLVAMLLAVVGFYCCSGQVLLQLFNRLYDWVMGNHSPQTADENQADANAETAEVVNEAAAETAPETTNETTDEAANTPLQTMAENAPLASTQNAAQPALTDVSQFTRPTITRFKSEASEPVENGEMPPAFITESKAAAPLPTVRIAPMAENFTETEAQNTPQAVNSAAIFAPPPEMVLAPAAASEPTLPKIRLNNDPLFAPLSPELLENIGASSEPAPSTANELPSISLPQAPQETAITSPQAPKFAQPTAGTLLAEIDEQNEQVQVEEAQAEQAVDFPPNFTPSAEPPNAAKTYPKSYGNTLIHPLLQRNTVVEKPTTPLPTLDLLSQNKSEVPRVSEQEILDTSSRIEKELANFGVKATVEDVLEGPVVTRYEILPAAGVKAAKIMNLAKDLARALIFKAIRITDVVPGKPYMGIETPNRHRETVWLRDVLASEAFQHSQATLPMALGKDISGNPVVVDMAKMPHLLVAGQTGGGKSVGVNTMILSLLFKLSPEQVRFIMIDPKVVELSIYNDIPHLLTPVVTDMKKAENALRWAVEEMERRYLLVSSLSVRNIESYNEKIQEAEAIGMPIPNVLWRPGDTMDALPPPLSKMSYIVLIVDEFADLMMSAGKQVEDHIMRIAQKARAVGIHLILATQRPSTDVITGVIKANIPSRIAFTVASQIDSRTILDKGGAESLLGRGDMLYSGAGSPEIIRVHGAFMSDADVQRVADNWRARGKPEYIDSIVASAEEENGENGASASGELDERFDEVAQFMLEGGATSISGIQRRFSLGFNRAARIIDQLEAQGILSPPDSRGKREVLR